MKSVHSILSMTRGLPTNFPTDTDFVVADGPERCAYNIIGSKADIIFKQAAKCGAQTFAQTKVERLEFEPTTEAWNDDLPNPGRLVSAKLSRKDGS